jgi:hypothetical protein
MNTQNFRPAQRLCRALFLTLCGLAASLAQAQNFETYYGENPARDSGEDVKSVNVCTGVGSIVAGTRRTAVATEILVTRADNNGVALWQRAYRIGGATSSTAQAVVEIRDGSGFALTGSVTRPAGTFIHVLRIDCNGGFMWSRVFANQAANHRSMGYDIIEAVNPAVPGAAGDLVAVGEENFAVPAGSVQGHIIRLNAAGGLLFNRAYNQPAPQLGLRFRAVTESRSAAGGADDLVISGSSAFGANWGIDRRALMFRTRFNGAPVCNSSMGIVDSTNEDFYGVVNLTFGNFPQETVLVGASTPPVTGSLPLYMVRFRALGCVPMVQAMWRDPVDVATAYDVVEIPAGLVNAGSVIAAGTLRSAVTAGDGFSLTATPATLGPNGAAFRYSTQSTRAETIFSLDIKRDRFVMAGSTFSDWDGVADGQDFYLVQTDPNRKTQCTVPWNFSWSPVNLPRQQFTPLVATIQASQLVNTLVLNATDEGYCCVLDPN